MHRREAWALLRLPPGSHIDLVRTRYRALARRWHPDRFEAGSLFQEEATREMQRINDAYRLLVEAAAAVPRRDPGADDDRPSGSPLKKEEVDELINAIGAQSWVHEGWLGARPHWLWRGYESDREQWALTSLAAGMLVFAAGLLIVLVLDWYSIEISRGQTTVLWVLLSCAALTAIVMVRGRGEI